MSDVVMWVKFKVDMYEDTKLKIIDSEEKRDLYYYIWARSIVLAGKINLGGYLYITENMPHTIKTLAIEFNRSVGEVNDAFKILRKLEMIELTEDKVFKIKNWEKHQNVEGMERAKQLNINRVAKCRAKKKAANDNGENTSNDINGDIKESKNNYTIENNNKDSSDKKCNVTCNAENSNCNVTVMEQNKKEIENENSVGDINNKSLTCNEEVSKSSLLENNNTKSESSEDNINLKDLELIQYHEKITGKVGGCDYVALRAAIDIHGVKWVKMAMDVGFEKNCPDIKYAIGILKNWRREGYPEENMEVKKNGVRSTGTSNTTDKNIFAGFKPKEPRKLTEAQRKWAEENLI
ncbi:putative phage replisome organizer [Clostridium saccharoperbutylacetonicum]|uniref:DnaD-like protein,putative phage replisome organizer n=1 Tax=Clostridium saccharoperbutylacetonicum N1-4(HMT) TaxID=931276 RepID=M1MHS8_9CLOT|nr:phage replisome organizer N-terminal domain-containing protein [Clostridium saccharoperbutylacetonicum]AGF57484.1 DnaD-like protein,putative phage replisome organizer [Clostridium saccharoperbutylacetonicum N1-4(HMT)]NRT61749.1 putative phage replisome organizer [Clostridium saccharoperbutylacetonicum]NSB25073.1 putative phage replisome organizer [Clostridium saccharoperbutylacetonicum]NSB44443.1 putative phage replisome organizer [Clostridium saccharoperbutylacetonicum]